MAHTALDAAIVLIFTGMKNSEMIPNGIVKLFLLKYTKKLILVFVAKKSKIFNQKKNSVFFQRASKGHI